MPGIRGLGAGGQGEINSRLGVLGKKCEASQQLGALPYRPVGKKSRGAVAQGAGSSFPLRPWVSVWCWGQSLPSEFEVRDLALRFPGTLLTLCLSV